MTFLAVNTRTARKLHRCDWCPEVVQPGEKYVDERTIFDGEFQALKFHPECKTACSEMARLERGDFEIDIRGYKRGSIEAR